jgi:hypothetical protein
MRGITHSVEVVKQGGESAKEEKAPNIPKLMAQQPAAARGTGGWPFALFAVICLLVRGKLIFGQRRAAFLLLLFKVDLFGFSN